MPAALEGVSYESKIQLFKRRHSKANSCKWVRKIYKKEPVDYDSLVGWLDINYYKKTREANYRFLDPKLIVEPPVFGRHNVDDIKFFTYKGKVRIIQVDMDRHTNHTRMLYD
ncbi:MAG: ATP-grasp fold amidoligase family protein, partial [Limisphaerales bacterium]